MATRGTSTKIEVLRETRSLNPRPESVIDDIFVASPFLDPRDLLQVKYEMVRRVRVDGMTVSHSAAVFGFSRPTFYEAAAALDVAGVAGLLPRRPGPRGAHKLTPAVVDFAAEQIRRRGVRPVDVVDDIAARFGVHVHPRSVERALAHRRSSAAGRGPG